MAQDNSWGRGYYPLPAHLSGLGRFMDGLKPRKLIDHKVWPEDPTAGGDIHMLTVVDRDVSIMVRDIQSLIELGLIRIQSNNPGEVSFYFVDKTRSVKEGRRGPAGVREFPRDVPPIDWRQVRPPMSVSYEKGNYYVRLPDGTEARATWDGWDEDDARRAVGYLNRLVQHKPNLKASRRPKALGSARRRR